MHYSSATSAPRSWSSCATGLTQIATWCTCLTAFAADYGQREKEREREEGEREGIAPKSDATPRCETESAARRSVRIYGRAERHADRQGDRHTGQTVGQTARQDYGTVWTVGWTKVF